MQKMQRLCLTFNTGWTTMDILSDLLLATYNASMIKYLFFQCLTFESHIVFSVRCNYLSGFDT